MHKKLLLTTILLSSIHMANATCTPPTTLKCNCAHPIINSAGELACGTSYCGDKKCMPNGSCCPEDNYCESSEKGKQCCAEGQTCDTTSGCVEKACITDCTNQENGTECCTSSGVAGVCIKGTKDCQTKTCDDGEKLYVYYEYWPDSFNFNDPSLGCCTNDPTNSFMHYKPDGTPADSSTVQLCCPKEKPIYARTGKSLEPSLTYYGCTEKGTNVISDCSGEGVTKTKTANECLGASEIALSYSYCEGGEANMSAWLCDSYYSDGTCYSWSRSCLSN